jgi:hypothetical protein
MDAIGQHCISGGALSRHATAPIAGTAAIATISIHATILNGSGIRLLKFCQSMTTKSVTLITKNRERVSFHIKRGLAVPIAKPDGIVLRSFDAPGGKGDLSSQYPRTNPPPPRQKAVLPYLALLLVMLLLVLLMMVALCECRRRQKAKHGTCQQECN